MKIFKVLALTIIVICVAACGGKGDSVTLKVESEFGELGKFVSPADDEVVVKLTDDKDNGQDVKAIVASFAFRVSQSVISDNGFYITATVLDENHIEIGTLPDFEIESTMVDTDNDMCYVLQIGTIRAQMNEKTKIEEWQSKHHEMWEKIKAQGKYIVLKLLVPDAKFVEYNGNTDSIDFADDVAEDNNDDSALASDDDADNDNTDSSYSSGSEDWDALLDSYEQYVDKYISFAKKAAKGDMNALSEYPALLQKAQNLSKKLQNAKGEMSPSQLERYARISNKLLQAASEM